MGLYKILGHKEEEAIDSIQSHWDRVLRKLGRVIMWTVPRGLCGEQRQEVKRAVWIKKIRPGPHQWNLSWGETEGAEAGKGGRAQMMHPGSQMTNFIGSFQWKMETLSKWKNEHVTCSATQLCPTLCDPMDCSPPGSSLHGISQARILEWIAFPPPGDLPNPGIKLRSPTSQADSSEPPGKPTY